MLTTTRLNLDGVIIDIDEDSTGLHWVMAITDRAEIELGAYRSHMAAEAVARRWIADHPAEVPYTCPQCGHDADDHPLVQRTGLHSDGTEYDYETQECPT